MINTNKPEPFKGTYKIIKYNHPEVVYKTKEVSSKQEFDTLLNEVVQYNKNHPEKEEQWMLIQG